MNINNQPQTKPSFGMNFSKETYKLAEAAGEKTLNLLNKLANDSSSSDIFVNVTAPKTTNKLKLFLANKFSSYAEKHLDCSWSVDFRVPKILGASISLPILFKPQSSFNNIVEHYLDKPNTIQRLNFRMREHLKFYPENCLDDAQLKFLKEAQK